MNRIQKIVAFGRPGGGKTFFSLKLHVQINIAYIISTNTILLYFKLGGKREYRAYANPTIDCRFG